MKKSTQEWLTGILIGIIISILFLHKIAFGATVTLGDVELLARTAEAEAGTQSVMGKRLVVATIINRADHEAFPNTIEGVLSEPGQFSTYRHLGSVTPSDEAYLAVWQELEQTCNSSVLFFQTGGYGCGEPLMHYEDHYFTTLRGGEL